MADELKTNEQIISSMIADNLKVIQHYEKIQQQYEELILLQKVENERLRKLQLVPEDIEELKKLQLNNGITNQFNKDAVRKLEKKVQELEKQLQDANKRIQDESDRANCTADALRTEQFTNKQIQKAQESLKERQKLGMAEKKNKSRTKFIEYVHSYLTNPALNSGDDRLLMQKILIDLHISDRTVITMADEIRDGLQPCGYEDVKAWAKKKNRFKKKV